MELLEYKEHDCSHEIADTLKKSTLSYLSPLDGFNSSFGFFFGVSFWIEDDLWLEGKINKPYTV